MEINRRWVQARRSETLVSPSDFRFEETPVPVPEDSKLLVRPHHLSAPAVE
jgi:NADPH-dependent curcumin reductase CurA